MLLDYKLPDLDGLDLVELPDAAECCGFGGTLRTLARMGCSVKGIDISENCVDHARAAAEETGLDDRIDVAVGDLQASVLIEGIGNRSQNFAVQALGLRILPVEAIVPELWFDAELAQAVAENRFYVLMQQTGAEQPEASALTESTSWPHADCPKACAPLPKSARARSTRRSSRPARGSGRRAFHPRGRGGPADR